MEPEYTRTPGASIPFVVFVDNGINPATTSNPYNYLFEFVEVAGLIGVSNFLSLKQSVAESTNCNDLVNGLFPFSKQDVTGLTNFPGGNFGIILAYSVNNSPDRYSYRIQIGCVAGIGLCYRHHWDGNWTEWKAIG